MGKSRRECLNRVLRAVLVADGLLLATCVPALAGPAAEPVDRWQVLVDHINRLEAQNERVQTARAEFDVEFIPTAKDATLAIARVNQRRGQSLDFNTVAAKKAPDFAYRSTWARRGNKEREDKSFASGRRESTAFDGKQFSKIVKLDNGQTEQSWSAPSHRALSPGRPQPFHWTCEFQGDPLAEFLRTATERDVEIGSYLGKSREVIWAASRTGRALSLKLTFDEQHRLTSREVWVVGGNYLVDYSRDFRLAMRQDYSDHVACDDGAGHTVWFPRRIEIHNYIGQLADGVPVEKYTAIIHLRHIEINVPVDDSVFVLPMGQKQRVARELEPPPASPY